jgi:EAL domain-containing protein (putative c-di-GMP-specific phosphodiesterase class I)
VQFKGGVFALKVISALADSGLPARRLELEITEAVLIGDDEAALKVLHELRAIGVRVALDDFGTGYSSLSYLRRFPFDKIKIDRSFINTLTGEQGSSGIVRAVVAMASAHKMATTAEGVETEEQRDMLRQLQCEEMQGFLFSAAKESSEIRQMFGTEQAKQLTAGA